ncbi:hypothetical protein AB2T55_03120 [Clostridium butyricum]|uniref:hypothetical protein n=1 Tax=Clostridium TaxID=1485 RepID=UPI002103BC2B|nr:MULTISPECIES: hypothetical protein [Clostridium]MDU1338694.1 hypothetical protein [Clostridium butyricum]UTY53196.1 hypothetical protein HNS01_08920 [Clostridium butyricum]
MIENIPNNIIPTSDNILHKISINLPTKVPAENNENLESSKIELFNKASTALPTIQYNN